MKKTYIYIATSVFCWSTVATITKILLSDLDSFQVLYISSFFAFAILLVFNIATGNIKAISKYRIKDLALSVLISIPSTVFYYIFYYTGTDLMPASQAFIVNYLWPIMSVVFACIILKEKVGFKKILAILISFVGLLVSMQDAILHFNKSMILGAVFCMLGAMSYGLFTALNQKFDYNKWVTLMIGYLFSFVLMFIINAATDKLFAPGFIQCIGFAWNGIFTMAVANVCWTLALMSGDTARVSNFAYITPFLSLFWTALFLKEEINLFSIIGLIIIVLGVVIQNIKVERSK
ncbi:MAG: DMT family transporter [Clostridia bacterium]|nr:DMT family transporter [Clostridia bacterium]